MSVIAKNDGIVGIGQRLHGQAAEARQTEDELGEDRAVDDGDHDKGRAV